jgi:hypothetical protein
MFSLQVTFRQQWTDQRLAYGDNEYIADNFGKVEQTFAFTPKRKPIFSLTQNLPGYLALTAAGTTGIWTPDTFFRNERAAFIHDISQLNALAWVYANGSVTYGYRCG